ADDRAERDTGAGRGGRQLRDDGDGDRRGAQQLQRDVCGGQLRHHHGGGDGDGGRRHQGVRHDGPGAECDGDRLHDGRCADDHADRDARAGRGGRIGRAAGGGGGGRAQQLDRDGGGGQVQQQRGG